MLTIRLGLISIFLSVFLTIPLCGSEVKDLCDFEILTENCTLFSPTGKEKIELPDGTIIPNFSAILRAESQNRVYEQLSREPRGSLKNDVDFLKAKRRLLGVLDEVSERIMDPKFKFFVTENFLDFMNFIGQSNGSLKGEMNLPWPPELTRGEQTVRREEVAVRFLSLFNPGQLERLQVIEREVRISLKLSGESRLVSSLNEEMQAVTPEREAYISKLTEFARDRVIELISNGRPEGRLTDAERQMIRKVRGIRVTPARDESLKNSPHCGSLSANGFYSKGEHTINICPAAYRLPDTAILSLIAHEISHSIDPCSSQFGTYDIKKEKIKVLAQGILGGISKEVTKDEERAVMLLILATLAERTTTTALPFPLIVSEKTIQYFKDKGILEARAAGVPFENYILKDVYDCLKNKKGFRGFDNVSIEKMASDVVNVRKQYLSQSYNPILDKTEIINAYKTYPECIGAEKNGQMGEAVADWVSARVVGEFVSGMHFSSPLERLGPVAVFGNMVCLQRYAASKKKERGIASVISGVAQDLPYVMDAHPGSKERIEKIFLVDRNIRKALGCPVKESLACEHRAK